MVPGRVYILRDKGEGTKERLALLRGLLLGLCYAADECLATECGSEEWGGWEDVVETGY
jgi:hypothetical protein